MLSSLVSVHMALQLMGDPTPEKLQALGFYPVEGDPDAAAMWEVRTEHLGFIFTIEMRNTRVQGIWSCLLMISNLSSTSSMAPLGVVGESLWHLNDGTWSFSRGIM
jgi:hypothetical protein